MRKLLFCVSLLALLIVGTISAYNVIEVPEAAARMSVSVVGGGVPVGSETCTLLGAMTNDVAAYDFMNINTTTLSPGQSYTVSSGVKICKVGVRLQKMNGNISAKTYYAYIYHGSENPHTIAATSSGITGDNGWLASNGYVDFTFDTPYTTTSETIYIVFGTSEDATNYASIAHGNADNMSGIKATIDTSDGFWKNGHDWDICIKVYSMQ